MYHFIYTNISSENNVGILKARSENRHEEGGLLVCQWITLRRTKQQMPARNLKEFPPPPPLSIRCTCKYTYNTKQNDGITFPRFVNPNCYYQRVIRLNICIETDTRERVKPLNQN